MSVPRVFLPCAAEEKMRRRADTTAESFRDRAVKCAGALDAHAAFEFYGERTMRCFPGNSLKWEDDAGGSMPVQEAFGRERRQRRELFLPCTAEEKFAAVFSFFWHGNNAIRMKAMAISKIFIKN